VRASIYADACKRHIDAWFEGEEVDPDDGVPHLAAALCCLAIIVDARAAGKLNDDRMIEGGYRKLVTELTPHVARLKALHAAKNPRHYTIKDNTKEDTCEERTCQERAPTVDNDSLEELEEIAEAPAARSLAGVAASVQTATDEISQSPQDPGFVAHDAKRNIELAIKSGGRDLTMEGTAKTACASSRLTPLGEPDAPAAPRSTVSGRHGILDGTCNEDGAPDVEHHSVQGAIAASDAALSGQGTQGTSKGKESTVGAAPVAGTKSRNSWLFRKPSKV